MDDNHSFFEKQLSEAINTFRTQFSLIVQILAGLIAANIALVGVAFASKNAGVFAIAACLPVSTLFLRSIMHYYMLPITYVAISLEDKLDKRNADYLSSTFAIFIFSSEYYNKLLTISRMTHYQERIQALKMIKISLFDKQRKILSYLTILLSLLQVIIAIILKYYFNWPFFG